MKKIINLIKQNFDRVIKSFPITLIMIILYTLFIGICFDSDLIEIDVVEKITLFSVFFTLGSFYCENRFEKNNKIIALIITFIISIILTILNTRVDSILKEISIHISISYVLISIILSFYLLYKKSSLSFPEYLVKIFSNLLKNSILYLTLVFGLTLITTVFCYLILNDSDFDIIFRIQILLFGWFYLPNVLSSLVKIEDEVNNFIKVFICYTLEVLIIISYVIIYLYVFKVIILGDILSNIVFRILMCLFAFGLPIWTLVRYYDGKIGKLSIINDYLPHAFIPFIFIQIYALFIRINSYGITFSRYLGIMIILFEIIYIIIYIIKKDKLYLMFYISIIFILITMIVPKINMYDISYKSQVERIIKLLSQEKLTEKDKYSLMTSYNYLDNSEIGSKYIDDYLKEYQNEINKYRNSSIYYNDYNYLYGQKNISNLTIEDYKTMHVIELDKRESKDIQGIKLTVLEEEINISSILLDYMENNNNFDSYFKIHNEFDIDNYHLVLQSVNMSYNDNEIKYLEIFGYIFIK